MLACVQCAAFCENVLGCLLCRAACGQPRQPSARSGRARLVDGHHEALAEQRLDDVRRGARQALRELRDRHARLAHLDDVLLHRRGPGARLRARDAPLVARAAPRAQVLLLALGAARLAAEALVCRQVVPGRAAPPADRLRLWVLMNALSLVQLTPGPLLLLVSRCAPTARFSHIVPERAAPLQAHSHVLQDSERCCIQPLQTPRPLSRAWRLAARRPEPDPGKWRTACNTTRSGVTGSHLLSFQPK